MNYRKRFFDVYTKALDNYLKYVEYFFKKKRHKLKKNKKYCAKYS